MYLAAHNAIFMEKNIKIKFKNIKILFWDPDFIIFKLNVHFCILIFFLLHSSFGRHWESQILKTKK